MATSIEIHVSELINLKNLNVSVKLPFLSAKMAKRSGRGEWFIYLFWCKRSLILEPTSIVYGKVPLNRLTYKFHPYDVVLRKKNCMKIYCSLQGTYGLDCVRIIIFIFHKYYDINTYFIEFLYFKYHSKTLFFK